MNIAPLSASDFIPTWFDWLLRSTLISAAALWMLNLRRHHRASSRSAIARLGLIGVAALPVLGATLPPLSLPAPTSWQPYLQRTPAHLVAQALAPRWQAFDVLLHALYLVPVVLLLSSLVFSLRRLTDLACVSRDVAEPVWLDALARGMKLHGIRSRVDLRVSTEIASPLSFGWWRPTLLLDPATLARPEEAESVIGHELAHIARGDWVVLLLARLLCALLWFNPCVWLLAARNSELIELAADERAIGRGCSDRADYAQTLLNVLRRARTTSRLAANPMITTSTLSERIASLLTPTDTTPAPLRATVLTCLGASLFCVLVSTFEPRASATSLEMQRALQTLQQQVASAKAARDATRWQFEQINRMVVSKAGFVSAPGSSLHARWLALQQQNSEAENTLQQMQHLLMLLQSRPS